MTENGIASSGNPTVSANGASPASGYRVSMTGGALEVSARLATPEELELLVKVLEANKVLWANAGKTEVKCEVKPQLKAKPKIEFLEATPSQNA
jgi:hypothetical protein